MKTWIFGALAFILSLTSLLSQEADTVTVGGQMLALPAPQDLRRADLSQALPEDLNAVATSAGNRLLALFGKAPITLGNEPIFHAQTPKGTEEVVYAIEHFNEVANSLANLLGEPASGGSLANGETQFAGIYDQGEHHLNFATLGRQAEQTEGNEGLLTYVAASMNNVNGKVLNLYCIVPAEPESNRALAREQLATWQQAVLASNPAAQPEVIKQAMSPMKRGAIIGGITGLLGALIGTCFLKRKA